MVDSLNLGAIIKETGDFGRFQFLILVYVETMSLSFAWSLMLMGFGGATPDHWCADGNTTTTAAGNVSECNRDNVTACERFEFSSDKRTIVSEFSLVCGQKWVTHTITTVQFSGMLVGGILWGHFCDTFGRRLTMLVAFLLIAVGNLVGFFSVNWEMFAAMRFFIGLGISALNASSILFEFIRNKWRFWLGSVPFYAIYSGLLALFCWRVHDWRYVQLVAGCTALLALTGWKFVPESFRWLIAKGRLEEAEVIVKRMATTNRKPLPDMTKIRKLLQEEKRLVDKETSMKIYTVLDLFRYPKIRKMTILFSFIWLAGMFSYFGIVFDVPQLSGNLYLNMFLVSVVDLPGNLTVALVNIKLGRKWTSVSLTGIGGLFALAVGILQFIGLSNTQTVQTVFVLASKFFFNAGFVASYVWTSESFPTVIRHIGVGFVDTVSRFGALAAPQFITLSLKTPGLLYLTSGVTLLVASLACVFLQETKEKDLTDILPAKKGRSAKPARVDPI